MRTVRTSHFRRNLLLGTALVGSVIAGYGRRASAGFCYGAETYTCVAPAGADATQTLSGAPLRVDTTSGFGITVASGNAFTLTGFGGIDFTDANASSIFGDLRGMDARNTGGGSLNITSTGTITGLTDHGIYAGNNAFGTGVSINVEDVGGGLDGIRAYNNGGGVLSITSSGLVTGAVEGISATNSLYGTDFTVHVADVIGGYDSLVAVNFGSGALEIVASGTITGLTQYGVVGINTGTDLTISTAAVQGGFAGIRAGNYGSGAISITATGDVTGGMGGGPAGVFREGIRADNRQYSTDLTISAVNVAGGTSGIRANNYGTGDTSVTTTGDVVGTNGDGIYAADFTQGGSLTINAVNVSGAYSGITAFQQGTGDLSITATGLVSGTAGDGIFAFTSPFTTASSTISVNSVSGGLNGITAQHYGTGPIAITATGDVIGGTDGIRANNRGDGSMNITTSGTVSGGVEGIYARNEASATDLTVHAVDVVAGSDGLVATNFGTGALEIVTTGTVTGLTQYGIVGVNTGTDLTISTAAVQGGFTAIQAQNFGSGALSITATGDVTGNDAWRGILAINSVAGTDLTISTTNVRGNNALEAVNYGTGDLSIISTGTVLGIGNYGIIGFNSAQSGDFTISAANVAGTNTGISAYQQGGGVLSITSSGLVSGGADAAVLASSTANSSGMILNVADAVGGTDGIRVLYAGTGNPEISVSGHVSGLSHAGIAFNNANGSLTSINIGSGGEVDGGVAGISGINTSTPAAINNLGIVRNLSASPAGLAIEASGATAITNGGLVLGTVALGDEDDSFVNAAGGTWNTAGGIDIFGLGNDRIENTGTIIGAVAAGSTEVTTFAGLETFANHAGGIVSMRDGGTGDRTVISGDYIGDGGRVDVDTELGGDASPSDLLQIFGASTGSSFVGVTNVGGTGAATFQGIKVIEIGGVSSGTFALGNPDFTTADGRGAVVGGAYGYTLDQDATDGDWYLRSRLTQSTPGDPDPQPLYQPGVPLYESYAQVLGSLNGLPTLQQRVGDRYWTGNGNAVIEQGDGPGVGPDGVPEARPGSFTQKSALWTRMEGTHAKVDLRTSTSAASYDIDQWQLQSGLDLALHESQDGSMFIGGLNVRTGQASADISSVNGDGSIDTTAYGVGASLTWYGTGGFYVDAQAQYSWYDSDLRSQTAGRTLADGNDGSGYALSLETGKRIELNNGLTVTPQAQLVYSSIDFDGFDDAFGTNVSLVRGDGLNGRIGVSLDKEELWIGREGSNSRSHLYGIANLYYDFLDGSEVDVATVNFDSEDEKFWGGIGVGGSYNWKDDKYSIYGEGNVQTAFNDFGDSYALNSSSTSPPRRLSAAACRCRIPRACTKTSFGF